MRAMPSLSFLVRYHRIFEVLSVSMFEAYVIYIYVTYVNGDIAHVKWICKMYTAYYIIFNCIFYKCSYICKTCKWYIIHVTAFNICKCVCDKCECIYHACICTSNILHVNAYKTHINLDVIHVLTYRYV
jgi:hypothetical protein